MFEHLSETDVGRRRGTVQVDAAGYLSRNDIVVRVVAMLDLVLEQRDLPTD
jgi:hypothetical protein